jgi:hypothetical protein
MKIAVLMCGMPVSPQCAGSDGGVREGWHSFCKFLLSNLNDPDVFIHSGLEYPVGKDFFDAIKPKIYEVEPQFHHPETEQIVREIGYYCDSHVNSYVQQIYGWKKVWELKTRHEATTGTQYDFVVKVRPDFIYFKPITLDLFELDKISTLHHENSSVVPTEFACGPDHVMKLYCGMYDWLMEHGKHRLPKTHARLWDSPGQLYNCDLILTAYLVDEMGLQRGKQKLPEGCVCPFQVYRIMYRHQQGLYDSPPPTVEQEPSNVTNKTSLEGVTHVVDSSQGEHRGTVAKPRKQARTHSIGTPAGVPRRNRRVVGKGRILPRS